MLLGYGAQMFKGGELVTKELVISTVALLSMYDIEPAGGRRWGNPRLVKATSTKYPAKPVKAWVRRRQVRQEE